MGNDYKKSEKYYRQRRIADAKYREKNRERLREYHKQYRMKNAVKLREQYLSRKGIMPSPVSIKIGSFKPFGEND